MADYEIIKPKVDLRKKIKILPAGSDFDPVAKAEQAMQRLSVNFGNWMKDEIGKLGDAWHVIEADGLNEETVKALFRSTHDIKGQAHTMGFPIAGNIAGSLCNLFEHVPIEEIPLDLIKTHVQAITAVVNEDAREEDNVLGKELSIELETIANEIVAKYKPEDDQA